MRMGRPKTSWSVARVALEAVASGATHKEAAALVGLSDRTVWGLVQEHGVRVFKTRKRRVGALTIDEREEVLIGIERGESDAEIGVRLGRHRSSIWREIDKNGGRRRYRPNKAHHRADSVACRSRRGWTETRPELWTAVQVLLREEWSPQQIAKRLRRDHPDEPEWWVSHESIYQAIFVQAKGELRRELAACLRSGRARRRPRGRGKGGGNLTIANMVLLA